MSSVDFLGDSGFDVSEELVTELIKRVETRLARGEPATKTRLPLDKSAFPKLLCLDFNKWVDLARAHYGHPHGEPFKEALGAVERAVAGGRLVVPIAGVNASEVMRPTDPDRRRRTASFMVGVARNRSLVEPAAVLLAESHRAIEALVLDRPPTFHIRPNLLQPGVHAALFGAEPHVGRFPPQVTALLREFWREPEMSIAMLTAQFGHEAERRGDPAEEHAKVLVEAVRANDVALSIDERFRREIPNFLMGDRFGERLKEEVLDVVGVESEHFRNWLGDAENVAAARKEIPGLDVMGSLMFLRDRNADHPVHKNDGRDLAFLQVAVPYANVVVTENSWAHLARQSGLGARYGTIVLAKTTDLPSALVDLGCL